MPKKRSLDSLRDEFVNRYRVNLGSTAGLSTSKLKKMTRLELERGIRGHADMHGLKKHRR